MKLFDFSIDIDSRTNKHRNESPLYFFLFQYIFSIEVDNQNVGDHPVYKTLFSQQNKAPQMFENVMVYAGDPWYSSAHGYIKDLKYTTRSP